MNNYFALLLIIIVGFGVYYYCEVMEKKVLGLEKEVSNKNKNKNNSKNNKTKNSKNKTNKKSKSLTESSEVESMHSLKSNDISFGSGDSGISGLSFGSKSLASSFSSGFDSQSRGSGFSGDEDLSMGE